MDSNQRLLPCEGNTLPLSYAPVYLVFLAINGNEEACNDRYEKKMKEKEMIKYLQTKKRRALQVLWSMLDKFLAPFIDQGVILCISGGPDSRALLETVALWPKRSQGKIMVAYVDHKARKQSDQEGDYICFRAKRLGFDAVMLDILNVMSNEGDFRQARYQELFTLANDVAYKTIVTAHHGDDDAEGYLMALMGLGGGELGASMKEVYYINNIRICRPFLQLDKKDLLLALSFMKQTDYVVDSLDQDCQSKRSLVRYKIFPQLSKIDFNIKKRLGKLARYQSDQGDFMTQTVISSIDLSDNEAFINIDPLPHHALLQAALWYIMKKWGKDSDIRSSGPTIDAIVKEVYGGILKPCLDPKINRFNVRDPSIKKYHLSGMLLEKTSTGIVIRRL